MSERIRDAMAHIVAAKTTLAPFAVRSAKKPLTRHVNNGLWQLAKALEILGLEAASPAGGPSHRLDDPEAIDWKAQADEQEMYEIGMRDGYESAVQDIDLMTGGDGEYFASTLPGEGCPDPAAMKLRIVERFTSAEASLRTVEVEDPIELEPFGREKGEPWPGKPPTARALAECIADLATNDRQGLIQRVMFIIRRDRATVRAKHEPRALAAEARAQTAEAERDKFALALNDAVELAHPALVKGLASAEGEIRRLETEVLNAAFSDRLDDGGSPLTWQEIAQTAEADAAVSALRVGRLEEGLRDLIALPVGQTQLGYLDRGVGTKTINAAWLKARALLEPFVEEGKQEVSASSAGPECDAFMRATDGQSHSGKED